MRYAIFSDVHSNLEALEAVMDSYKKEGIDKYLCIGDLIGYGANPRECIEKVRSIASVVCAGNHDWAAVRLFSLEYFNSDARSAILWTRHLLSQGHQGFLESLKLTFKNEDLILVHGTLNNPHEFNYLSDAYIAEETFRLMDRNVCFVGHTHQPQIFSKDQNERIYAHKEAAVTLSNANKYIVNVGSVGQPRDGDPHASYCIYDSKEREIQIKRVKYNAEAARKKIIEKGLPKFLGDRLIAGR